MKKKVLVMMHYKGEPTSTVEHRQKITKKILGEHKEQQFLGRISFSFFVFKMAVAIVFLCENAVEAV